MNVCQPEIAAAVAVREAFVVDAELMEDRGPHVVDGAFFLDGVIAEIVGRAVDHAAFDAAAGHPDAEAVGVVVASVAALRERRPAKFASPDNERVVEQAA